MDWHRLFAAAGDKEDLSLFYQELPPDFQRFQDYLNKLPLYELVENLVQLLGLDSTGGQQATETIYLQALSGCGAQLHPHGAGRSARVFAVVGGARTRNLGAGARSGRRHAHHDDPQGQGPAVQGGDPAFFAPGTPTTTIAKPTFCGAAPPLLPSMHWD